MTNIEYYMNYSLPETTIQNAHMLAQSLLGTSMLHGYAVHHTLLFEVKNKRNVQASSPEGKLTQAQVDELKAVIRKRVPLFTIQRAVFFECKYVKGEHAVTVWVFKIITFTGEIISFATLPPDVELQTYLPLPLIKSVLKKWGGTNSTTVNHA